MNHLEDNQKILEKISEYVEKYPELRFIQILQILNIVDNSGEDRFYENSKETLNKIKKGC